MNTKHTYANGQIKQETNDGIMTHYFNDGTIKAKGPVDEEGNMQDEWEFYKKEGYLWQIGHFKENQKHGNWKRFDADGNIEYDEKFENNKQIL